MGEQTASREKIEKGRGKRAMEEAPWKEGSRKEGPTGEDRERWMDPIHLS
jgi:hypothetical protein